jgi:hypothetical protein
MQPSVPQADSRHPLTRLLGNGGNIRVLRALAADDQPLSVTQLAERCGLTPQGTRLALEPLVEGRLVKLLGGARSRLFTIDPRHPFAKPVRTLFAQEQTQWERLLQGLRGLLHRERDVIAAWYVEAAAGDEAGASRSLPVWLVLSEGPVEPFVTACRERYAALEQGSWTDCTLRGVSLADLLALSADPIWWKAQTSQARPLKGLDPSVLVLRSRKPAQAALFGP